MMKNEIHTLISEERDFTIAKKSPIHGNGLYAKKEIPKGTRILEYTGERILKKNLPADIINGLTSARYIMNLTKTTVIDAERNGNIARYINHNCNPNCIVYFFNDIPYIYSLRLIEAGEELSFDYQMGTINEIKKLPLQQKIALMPCMCGSANCRKTLLAI